MPYCEFCGEETGILPFICNYCGGHFCGKHRLPENHNCTLDIEFRKKQFKKKQRIREQHTKIKDIGERGQRPFIGTVAIYIILIIASISAYFYPYYLCISHFTLGPYPYSFIWTVFTSIFVIYFSNPIELAFFIILLVCSYYYVKTIENKYGSKFLLFLFISCSVLGGVINLFLSWFFYYYDFTIIYFPIGLASGGLLGVNLFLLLERSNKDWYFFNLKLKGKYLIWFLAIINIILKIISSILLFEELYFFIPEYYYSYSIVWYIFDLFGLLGAVIFYEGYFKRRY